MLILRSFWVRIKDNEYSKLMGIGFSCKFSFHRNWESKPTHFDQKRDLVSLLKSNSLLFQMFIMNVEDRHHVKVLCPNFLRELTLKQIILEVEQIRQNQNKILTKMYFSLNFCI